MAKNKKRSIRRTSSRHSPAPARTGSRPGRSRRRGAPPPSRAPVTEVLLDHLVRPHVVQEPRWKLLPLVLALAFAVRAAVALAGDFVLHPDEIMQYLEPAHRLAFGNGVMYWEYFYGARSWLVPGLVAGVLKVFDAVGLGEPRWYVDGVKLVFCALSAGDSGGHVPFWPAATSARPRRGWRCWRGRCGTN